MATATSNRYTSNHPTAIAQSPLSIDHPQLRDLLSCPHEQGVVLYLRHHDIVEQNLNRPDAPTRCLVHLGFTPSSLNSLAIGEDTLVASGGSWHAELHLSYHRPVPADADVPMFTEPEWSYNCKLNGTLNNSVVLTTSTSSAAEPRVGVTNNDGTFRLYDCAIRKQPLTFDSDDDSDEDEEDDSDGDDGRLDCVGSLRLDTCVNYASISPNGRMILTVGDSPNAYLHDLRGSSLVDFHPIAITPLPVPTNVPPHYPPERPSSFTASFSAAWARDGTKYAVGSQEGVVAVWDIRTTGRPLKVMQVDKMRGMGPGGLGAAVGSISWDPSDWFFSNAPSWSVRNVKFVGDENGVNESLVFTEHTSLVHVLDAKTFEHDEIVRVPSRMHESAPPPLAPLPPRLTLAAYSYRYNPSSTSLTASHSSPTLVQPVLRHQRSNSWPVTDPTTNHAASPLATTRDPESFAKLPKGAPLRFPDTVISGGYVFETPEFEYDDELDIAGLAFDPSGKWMYVGTDEGVVEWELRRR